MRMEEVNQRKLDSSDYEVLEYCPWCNSPSYKKWGQPIRGFQSAKCKDCGLIYVKNRLYDVGLQKYYTGHLTKRRAVNTVLNEQRKLMYEIEFKLIDKYARRTNVLDVGCSGGYFLDVFHNQGYECFGVELDKTAANEAKKTYHVWCGKFDALEIDKKFDLIVFRGVIEHIPYPKTYLDKAISLLSNYGLIYVTATPNSDAFCCELFKENWNQHVPEEHLMHFSPAHFDDYFEKAGFRKVIECFFYEETPYANIDQDILNVAEAIKLKKFNRQIDFKSPSFWGNMMSLIYHKYY